MTMTASQWISELNTVLSNAACRVGNKPAKTEEALETIKNLFIETKANGKAIYWVGNGGSQALCSHLSQDVLNKLQTRSYMLSDPALLTCMANDFGYESVYAKPLETLIQKDDLLIAVSSSGNSPNILNAVEVGQKKNARCIVLSAFTPSNKLNKIGANVSVHLPCTLYGHAELGHEAILHAVIETLWLKNKKG